MLKVSSVSSGRFVEGEAKRLPEGMGSRPDLEVRPGDVLLTRANGVRSLVGVACYVSTTRTQLMLSDKTLRVVPKASMAPAFLALLLSSQGVRRQIGGLLNGGTGQNNISQADVRALLVPDVPLDEQRHIVAVHATFERRIGTLEKILGKLEVAEKALCADVLNQGQEAGWRASALSEVATVAAGVTLGSEPAGDGTVEFPYLRVANVLDGRIDTADVKSVRILCSQYERYALRKGDLLLTEGGDLDKLGRGAVWDGRIGECLHQNHVFRVRCGDRVLSDFLALYTSSAQGRAYFQRVGKQTTNLASINSTQVKQMPVPVPPVAEQERLLEPIRATRRRAQAVENQIAKLRTIQRGACEDLLTGRVTAPRP
ncbi:restriction endonuclease subunit S [Streptomyces sp. NPDC052042]|uniref:restriction endonuclease subunit S n=1 Tax=Streptomyces sp. NPDC052042 TaxID=3365683 RepID=UPI0037D8E225